MNYQDSVIADRGGFILAWRITNASTGEWKAVTQLQERLPLQPVSLTGDIGYNAGELRQLLKHRNITASVPIADRGGFILAWRITNASTGEWKAVTQLQERLPLQPVSLTGDIGYNAGELRQLLKHRNITASVETHPSPAGIQHGFHRRLRLPGSSSGGSAGQDPEPGQVSQPGRR